MHILSALQTVGSQFWGTTRKIEKRQMRFDRQLKMRRNSFLKTIMQTDKVKLTLQEKDDQAKKCLDAREEIMGKIEDVSTPCMKELGPDPTTPTILRGNLFDVPDRPETPSPRLRALEQDYHSRRQAHIAFIESYLQVGQIENKSAH